MREPPRPGPKRDRARHSGRWLKEILLAQRRNGIPLDTNRPLSYDVRHG